MTLTDPASRQFNLSSACNSRWYATEDDHGHVKLHAMQMMHEEV
jgi:hypothetical protein